jgi:periplasmic protein TonB
MLFYLWKIGLQLHPYYEKRMITSKNHPMKTKMMNYEPRTLEDIVFEDRNKDYGAYALNRYCTKYLLIAFLISLAGVSTAIAVPFIKNMKNPGSILLQNHGITATLDPVDNNPVIPPPPPPPPLPIKTMEQAQYSAPRLVDNPPDGSDMIPVEQAIENNVNPPVLPDIIAVEPPSGEIDDPDKEEYLQPEEQASFMNGDLNEFRNWVQTRVQYPEIAIANGIFGKVIVGFCVNSKGQVVDVNIIRGVDASLDRETIRVITSSPLWKAARQGGVSVKQKFVIPVVYKLNS